MKKARPNRNQYPMPRVDLPFVFQVRVEGDRMHPDGDRAFTVYAKDEQGARETMRKFIRDFRTRDVRAKILRLVSPEEVHS